MTAAFQSRPNFNTKEANMPNDNIFSGLKVVDLASFIAGPSAAVILSDFGADVIKVSRRTVTYGESRTTCHRSRSPRMLTLGTLPIATSGVWRLI